MKFLTHDGLLYFWKKVKSYIDTGFLHKEIPVISETDVDNLENGTVYAYWDCDNAPGDYCIITTNKSTSGDGYQISIGVREGLVFTRTYKEDTGWGFWKGLSDADTVDGKHASDFLPKLPTRRDVTENPTSYPNGVWDVEGALTLANGHPIEGSWHITYFMHGQNNSEYGYRTLVAILPDTRMFVKTQSWNGWNGWKDLDNADTLDGKHASDFVQLTGGHGVFPKMGGSEGGEICLERSDTSKFIGDVIIDVNGNQLRILESGSPWRGCYIDLTSLGSNVSTNLRNADSVDGYHVDLGVNNTYGLRPIAMDTFDLQAGVTSMWQGQIYMMYE